MDLKLGKIFGSLISRIGLSRPTPLEPQLAGFGKHPCSGEHVPQQGMDEAFGLTGNLPQVRRRLYVEPFEPPNPLSRGVVSYWTAQPPESLIPMGHCFLWRMERSLVVGRLWQSQDSTGRGEFPFVLAAELPNIDAASALAVAIPLCLKLETDLHRTNQLQVVRQLLDNARAELLSAIKAPNGSSPRQTRSALAALRDDPGMGPDGDLLFRILFAIDHLDDSANADGLGSRLMRIPCAAAAPGDHAVVSDASPLLLWHDAIVQRFGDQSIMLALLPDSQPWIDVIIGQPKTDHLQCLRLKPPTIALASSLPPANDPQFRSRAEHWLGGGSAESGNPISHGAAIIPQHT